MHDGYDEWILLHTNLLYSQVSMQKKIMSRKRVRTATNYFVVVFSCEMCDHSFLPSENKTVSKLSCCVTHTHRLAIPHGQHSVSQHLAATQSLIIFDTHKYCWSYSIIRCDNIELPTIFMCEKKTVSKGWISHAQFTRLHFE